MIMVEVLVEHDYIAKEPDELSIRRGDVIREVICKNGGWWEGFLSNRRGVFPDNYVKIVESDAVALRSKADSYRIRKCRVVFSYRPAHEDELPLNVDDVVSIIGEEEEGWWRGTLHGREGVFPSNFVEEIAGKGKSNKSSSRESLNEIVDDLAFAKTPLLPPKPERIFEAKYAYTAENSDELTLNEGDIITLISKDGHDPGWWRGELNGQVGVFPDNFVVAVQNKVADHLPPLLLNQARYPEPQLHGGQEGSGTTPTSPQPEMPVNIRPSQIVQQRRSFDGKLEPDGGGGGKGATPPVLGKKPTVPIKKSPSGSGSGGGLFSGIRKKLADAVDGAAASKSSNKDSKMEDGAGGDFDQVERSSMLQDVRATRAKAPRRRPPGAAYKDGVAAGNDQPSLTNGNTGAMTTTSDPALTSSVVSSSSGGSLDMLPELLSSDNALDVTDDPQSPATALRPKVPEWQKHRAPWLEEMKLSQAKRTSTSPGPEKRPTKAGSNVPGTDGYDAPVTAVRSKDGPPPVSPQRTSLPPATAAAIPAPTPPIVAATRVSSSSSSGGGGSFDMSQSMPALGGALKAVGVAAATVTDADKPQLRQPKAQAQVQVSAAARTSLPSGNVSPVVVHIADAKLKALPIPATSVAKVSTPPKPVVHGPSGAVPGSIGDREHSGGANGDSLSRLADDGAATQALIAELQDRIDRLERDSQGHKAAIEDLRGKLQVETDLRRLLQAELDKVSRCAMQV